MARRNAQVGQAVSVGGALMAVVTTDQMVRRQLQRNTINPYANWSTG